MTHSFRIPKLSAVAGVTLGFLLNASAAMAQGAQMPPAMVTTMTITPESVTLVDELPGRVSAYRTVQIIPQVGGIIEERLFEQGAEVEQDQALYQIEAKAYQAQVDNAKASVASAKAALELAQISLERTRQLYEKKSASQQTYDSALAEAKSAEAGVEAAEASLRAQQINLEHTTIRSPINGRIGAALVSEGSLVGSSSGTALAVVQQIDQVYVDLRRSASDIAKLQKAAGDAANSVSAPASVGILDVDGNTLPNKGKALFTDLSVDESTGDVTMRVLVDNPDQHLLPGMFVRAAVPRKTLSDALLVPQQAVTRDAQGQAIVVTVDSNNTAHIQPIELGELVGRRYVVLSGLEPNTAVVVRGQSRVTQDGATVHATPADQPKP